jgi:nicotinate-nucleotide pyrophosphorylase (carboxylating)
MVGSQLIDMDKIRRWIREDVGYGDITSLALIPDGRRARAQLFTREDEAVAAGLLEAAAIFQEFNCQVTHHAKDGDIVEGGQILLTVDGPARGLLAAERTVLNIFQRMTSIATATREIQSKVLKVNNRTRVAATRKTVPGLRDEDKKAVELGGGDTHRLRLDDCVIIKDNHLRLVPSLTEAIKRARHHISFTKKIEVEVQNHEEAEEAARAGAEIIMYDNMTPEEIRDSLEKLDDSGLRKDRLFEASGGITRENAVAYAAAGVDIISLGSLTHSIEGLNVKIEIEMM